jgi:DNA-binding XRE family transcriptional regulator
MTREELKKLGTLCAEYRKRIGVTQTEVGKELGVSDKGVSHFENGRSTNLKYLCWYILHGLEVETIWQELGMIHGKATHRSSF